MGPLQETMPLVKRIEGGRTWLRKNSGVQGYSSADGNYDILCGDKHVVLVSFLHDPIDECEFWRKKFKTVEEAMEYAEKM